MTPHPTNRNSTGPVKSTDEDNTSRLYVIRHGETDYNRYHQMQGRGIDAPLNEAGHSQSMAIAEYLSGYGIDHVVSSSMLRARQTAEPIAINQRTVAVSHPDLDEMDFGHFEGRSIREIAGQIEEVRGIWKSGDTGFRIPGGESPAEVFTRADNRAHRYLAQYRGKNIAFVVHGRVIRILLSSWTGLGLENMELIDHANGAINLLSWDGDNFDVVWLNRTQHLETRQASST